MPENEYYVRSKGRIAGPFTVEKLQILVRRGTISRVDEVSSDRVIWSRAAEFVDLFPVSQSVVKKVSISKPADVPIVEYQPSDEEESGADAIAPVNLKPSDQLMDAVRHHTEHKHATESDNCVSIEDEMADSKPFSRRVWAILAASIIVVVATILTVLLWPAPSSDWEVKNQANLVAMEQKATGYLHAGKYAEAVLEYRNLFGLLGNQRITDADLNSTIAQARKEQFEARQKARQQLENMLAQARIIYNQKKYLEALGLYAQLLDILKKFDSKERNELGVDVVFSTTESEYRDLSVKYLPMVAGAFLMDSELSVWTLQGKALVETRQVLGRGINNVSNSKEPELRSLLHQKRSQELRTLAQQFINTLDTDSTVLLEDAAKRLGLTPSDFILDWITYESALDFGAINSLWTQRGNLKGKTSQNLATSLFQDLTTPPNLEQGVQVLSKTDKKIMVNLYGAVIIEEMVPNVCEITDETITVGWKSNYGFLRSVLSGEPQEEVIKETLERRPQRLGVTYKEYFENYLAGGITRPWATLLAGDDVLALSRLIKEEKILAANGYKPAEVKIAPSSGNREGLQAIYRRLAPSVPMVECVGRSTGSGFVINNGTDLWMITNRHVVSDSPRGFRLHFYGLNGDAKKETTADVPPEAVTAISKETDIVMVSLASLPAELKRAITPVVIAKNDPEVGENIFVIGHPGGGGQILTTTLTNGIVSSLRTMEGNGPCVQITAAINPGNSGGPLFNDRGEVVGIVTFMARKGENGLALESLNFALSVTSINALIDNPAKNSLTKAEIASVVSPQNQNGQSRAEAPEIIRRAAAVVARMRADGYRQSGLQVLNLRAGATKTYNLPAIRKEYAIVALSSDSSHGDVDAAILDRYGNVIASDFEDTDMALVPFRVLIPGQFTILIKNSDSSAAEIIVILMEK